MRYNTDIINNKIPDIIKKTNESGHKLVGINYVDQMIYTYDPKRKLKRGFPFWYIINGGMV